MEQLLKFDDFVIEENLDYINENIELILTAIIESDEVDEGFGDAAKAAGDAKNVSKGAMSALIMVGGITLIVKLTKLIKRKVRISKLASEADSPEEKAKYKSELDKLKDSEIKARAKMKGAKEKGLKKFKALSPEEKAKVEAKADAMLKKYA